MTREGANGIARLGGYQGPSSILTRALGHFSKQLALGPQACRSHVEADVTQAGESARSLFDSVEAGRREVCYVASGYLASRVPELAVLDLPFSVHDRHTALRAMDGDVGDWLAEAVSRQTGLRVLAFWDNGFRHLTNNRHPIRSPDDCRGLTIRTLDSADYRATMEALGFEALSIDVRELYAAVASGRVDAQENPLTNFVLFELWRHHRHVSLTGHLFGVALFVCNQAWFAALSEAQQSWLLDCAREAAALQRQLAEAEDASALAYLRQVGVNIVEPSDIDLPAMIRCCEPLMRSRQTQRLEPFLSRYLQKPDS